MSKWKNDKLSEAIYISVMNVTLAYHHIPLKKEDRHKTALESTTGKWMYKKMPMGLKTGAAAYQDSMDMVIADLQDTRAYMI